MKVKAKGKKLKKDKSQTTVNKTLHINFTNQQHEPGQTSRTITDTSYPESLTYSAPVRILLIYLLNFLGDFDSKSRISTPEANIEVDQTGEKFSTTLEGFFNDLAGNRNENNIVGKDDMDDVLVPLATGSLTFL